MRTQWRLISDLPGWNSGDEGVDQFMIVFASVVAVLGGTEMLLIVSVLVSMGGAVAAWMAFLRRSPAPDNRMEEELRSQLASRDNELNLLRKAVVESRDAAAASEGRRLAAEQLQELRADEARQARELVASLRNQTAVLESDRANLRAEVEKGNTLLNEQRRFHEESVRTQREKHDLARVELRQAGERSLALLRDQFKGLAAEALAANNPEFLRLAGEKFAGFKASAEGDLAQREAKIEALVRPLEEQLRSYQQRLQQSDAHQQTSLGQVQEQLRLLTTQSESLSNETLRLRLVLSSHQARGRWGEETLRRVVEAAGLSAHCDFTEQTKEGDGKPDLVVRLPGDRVILVDSKVPDLAFLEALGAAEEVKRRTALEAHARNLRETIKDLAGRNYPKAFSNALDFVVLFLPAESLFSAALEGDPELILWAAEKRVLLATPASLIALLRSVAVSWQQYELSVNNRQIGDAARELFDRVQTFLTHFERIRKGLNDASEGFNAAVSSYERRVRPAGDRLTRLTGKAEKEELEEIQPVSSSLRELPRLPAPDSN
jgi:DNA recombination protein RmuC